MFLREVLYSENHDLDIFCQLLRIVRRYEDKRPWIDVARTQTFCAACDFLYADLKQI